MSEPKGTQEVYDFLAANKPITAAKELPSSLVLREAILHVAITLHQANLVLQEEVSNLKAKQPAGEPSNTAGATPSNAAGTPSNAAATQNAAGDSTPKSEQVPLTLSVAANSFVPSAKKNDSKSMATSAPTEKSEAEKLCRSMWGYKECPKNSGEECVRIHLLICDRPVCYGNPDVCQTCQESTGKWHGHIKAAHVAQRKRERQEAKNRQQEAEKKEFMSKRKEFLAWNKKQGNLVNPSGRGKPAKGASWGHTKQENKGKQRVQRGPSDRTLGDFYPKQHSNRTFRPAPAPVKSAWEQPLVTRRNPPTDARSEARGQIQELLLNLTEVLQQVL